MSRLHDLRTRIESLDDIDNIMVAMKNIAFMETRRLAQFLSAQQHAVANIETAAGDFINHYGHALPLTATTRDAYLVIGSERGLCGDFNQRAIDALLEQLGSHTQANVLAVGQRLEPHLVDVPLAVTLLSGPSVAEDVTPVLIEVAKSLANMEKDFPPDTVLALTAIYHSDETNGIRARRILPLPATPSDSLSTAFPPQLNLDPRKLLTQLTEHYLFAAMHEAFFSSLMAENQFRLEHMNQAIQRLERKVADIRLQYNAWRQEEITEEIEIIMLSVEALAKFSTNFVN